MLTTRLANDLAIGLTVQFDVDSDVPGLVRGRSGARVTAESCRVLKSGSGVSCPAPVKQVSLHQSSPTLFDFC